MDGFCLHGSTICGGIWHVRLVLDSIGSLVRGGRLHYGFESQKRRLKPGARYRKGARIYVSTLMSKVGKALVYIMRFAVDSAQCAQCVYKRLVPVRVTARALKNSFILRVVAVAI